MKATMGGIAALVLLPALAWAQNPMAVPPTFSTGEDLLGDLKHTEVIRSFGAGLWIAGVTEGMIISGALQCNGRGYYLIKPLVVSAGLEKELASVPTEERQKKTALRYVVDTRECQEFCV